jgi:hypothetical protein
VRDSSCTFIRNGSEHTSLAASEHIAKKAGMARSRIKDGDTLIDTVATKSSITGRALLRAVSRSSENGVGDLAAPGTEPLPRRA